MSETQAPQASVLTTDRNNPRRLFKGLAEDAREFVENHFPKLHVEPGTDYGDDGPRADVEVVHESGKVERYHGDKAGWVTTQEAPVTAPAAPAEEHPEGGDDA